MRGIILHEQKLVYWYIEKCACTAIKTFIANKLGLLYDNVHTAPFELTNKSIEGYINIAILRDPFDRLLSLYCEKINGGKIDDNVFGRWPDKFMAGMSYYDFIEAILSIPIEEADPHFAPQTRLIPDDCEIYNYDIIKPLLLLFLPLMNVTQNKIKVNIPLLQQRNILNHYHQTFQLLYS